MDFHNIHHPVFDILNGDIAQIKSDWDNALFYFEKASNSSDIIVKSEGIIKYGEILFRKGEFNEALKYYNIAFDFTKEHSLKKYEARALNDIGLVNAEFGNYEVAKTNLDQSLHIRILINDQDGIAATNNNIGVIYSKKKMHGKALKFYENSLKNAQEIGDKRHVALYSANLSEALLKLNKLPEAIVMNDLSSKMHEELHDKAGISVNKNILGMIYIDEKKYRDALKVFEESHDILGEIGNKKGLGASYCNIGVVHFYEKNYFLATVNFLKAYASSARIGKKDTLIQAKTFLDLVSNTIGKKDFKNLVESCINNIELEFVDYLQIGELLNEPKTRNFIKLGRNNPCHCNSGKKYKDCHLKIDIQNNS